MKDKITTGDIEAKQITTEDLAQRQKMIAEAEGLIASGTRTISAPPEAPRARVLREAGEAVLVDRSAAYGPPEDSFAKIASLWNGYLHARMEPFDNLTPLDACNMMELLKIARSISNPAHFDNYTDRAGYAACAADLADALAMTDEQKARLDELEGE